MVSQPSLEAVHMPSDTSTVVAMDEPSPEAAPATNGDHPIDPDEAVRETIRQRIRTTNETLLGVSAKPVRRMAKWLTTILFAPGPGR